jgi:hypothetical protein
MMRFMDREGVLEWRRGWIPRGLQTAQPFDAWLPEPDELAFISSEVVELDDLADVPCLLLVGEPGSGKSYELYRAARQAEESKDAGDEVKFFDLGRPASAAELKDDLFAAPELIRFKASQGRLFLFLDSLDEAKVQVRKVVRVLKDELDGLDFGRLVLRVACRTFDLPQSFVEWLENRYRDNNVWTIELAPLRRSEAGAAARTAGLDPSAFLGEVDAVGAEAFAARPLTLKLLIRIIQAEGRLPARLHDIYLRGLKLMAVEYDEDRPSAGLSSTAALAVASRIAAATVLAGHDAVDHQARGLPGTVSMAHHLRRIGGSHHGRKKRPVSPCTHGRAPGATRISGGSREVLRPASDSLGGGALFSPSTVAHSRVSYRIGFQESRGQKPTISSQRRPPACASRRAVVCSPWSRASAAARASAQIASACCSARCLAAWLSRPVVSSWKVVRSPSWSRQ